MPGPTHVIVLAAGKGSRLGALGAETPKWLLQVGEATIAEFPAAHGRLLRDVSNPSRFISFGPWESLEEVDAWRASAPFQEGVARVRTLLDAFEPGTYQLSADVSASDAR